MRYILAFLAGVALGLWVMQWLDSQLIKEYEDLARACCGFILKP